MSAGAIPPAAIAAAATAARAFLRSDAAGEDALVERLAAAAIQLGEAFTGTLFVRRGCEDVVAATRGWQPLAAVPVVAISGVTGLVSDGAPFVLSPADFAIDIDSEARGWVRVLHAGAATRVAVAYRAGLAETWDMLPAPIAQGTVALIAHLFDDRAGATLPPAAVVALWRPYRRMRIGVEARA